MTKNVSETVNPEEADKGNKLSLEDITLRTIADVPSVADLHRFSNARLTAAHQHWSWLDYELSQKLKDNPSEELMQQSAAIGHYLANLRLAQEPHYPQIPDDRPEGWVGLDDTVVVFQINCGSPHRFVRRATGIVEGIVIPTKPGNAELHPSLTIRFDAAKLDWPMDTCEYDLCSPYVMAPEEVAYFSAHPSDLNTWITECGKKFGDFRVNDELRNALLQEFSTVS